MLMWILIWILIQISIQVLIQIPLHYRSPYLFLRRQSSLFVLRMKRGWPCTSMAKSMDMGFESTDHGQPEISQSESFILSVIRLVIQPSLAFNPDELRV